MARLKACSVCGRIHGTDIKCYKPDKRADNEHMLRQKNKWHIKSLDIRERSHYLCAVCFDKGILSSNNLEVHHITKLRDNPDGLLDDENLICLCASCHKEADAGNIDADYLRELAKKRDNHQL